MSEKKIRESLFFTDLSMREILALGTVTDAIAEHLNGNPTRSVISALIGMGISGALVEGMSREELLERVGRVYDGLRDPKTHEVIHEANAPATADDLMSILEGGSN